jgi:hypothetical protein
MRELFLPVALLLFGSSLSSAELWTGELFDADCVEHHKEMQKYEECIPADRTVTFVLQTSGRILKLDAGGNRKAAAAWKEYVDKLRVIDPDLKTKPVTATVEGAVSGDEIMVDSIQLR